MDGQINIYCDSSTNEACYVIEGQDPIITPYPKTVTVNVGEYLAVILALKEAKRLKLKQFMLMTDSQLIVNQTNGAWKCRKAHLLPYRDRVRELLSELGADLAWVRREVNLAGLVLE